MDVDPVASLRCWAVEIELGSRTFEVPALPAADWFPILLSGDLSAVLDLIVSTPDDPLAELLLSGEMSVSDLTQALTDAVEEVAGRSWWASYVIAGVARHHWAELNGNLARRGFRWDAQPLGAALDALYALLCESITEQARLDEFRALLDRPPGKPDSEQAMAEFEAIAGPKPPAAPIAVSKGGQTPRSGVSRARSERSSAEPSGSAPTKTRRQRQPRRQAGP